MLSCAKFTVKTARPFFLLILVITVLGLAYRWSGRLADPFVLVEILVRGLLAAFALTAILTVFLLLLFGIPIWLSRKKYDE
jgi:hypothetical protein